MPENGADVRYRSKEVGVFFSAQASSGWGIVVVLVTRERCCSYVDLSANVLESTQSIEGGGRRGVSESSYR